LEHGCEMTEHHENAAPSAAGPSVNRSAPAAAQRTATKETTKVDDVPAAPMPTFEKSCYGAVGGAVSFSHVDPYELFAHEFKVGPAPPALRHPASSL